MDIFRYGPLVYITAGMDADQGNYFWNGSPPIGYDNDGVPIDEKGLQCLDVSCPLHPAHEPETTEYSEALNSNIPTLDSFRKWFDDNFLIVSDSQIKRWIIRWWSKHTQHVDPSLYYLIIKRYSSVEEIMEATWPDELKS